MAKRVKQLTADEILKAVPYANDAIKLEVRPDGSALASVPMQKPKWVDGPMGWFLPYSTHRRVELDEIGVVVLKLCDGKRKVEEIVEEFAKRHMLSWREAQICVLAFLRQIVERGLVVIVGLSPNDQLGRQ